MFKSFEDVQAAGKENFEAVTASVLEVSKAYQDAAQEVSEYSKQSFEKGVAAWKKASGAKSIENALEIQQAYAKESFDAGVAEMVKLNQIFSTAAKSFFKPLEKSFAVATATAKAGAK